MAECVMEDGSRFAIPHGTELLEEQVGGHEFIKGKETMSMLKDKDGHVLKYINKPILGEKENKFYEVLQNTDDPELLKLKKFVPEYFGTTTLKIANQDVRFLILSNLIEDLNEPRIMDIKIGYQTHEPGAPKEKVLAEESKYAGTKKSWGFCIPGFQIYNKETGKREKYGKDFGKHLQKDAVKNLFKTFVDQYSSRSISIQTVLSFLHQLTQIQSWFQSQRIYHFYSSSLLFSYDEHRAHVHMIDFAHVIPARDSTLDSNYLDGLNNVIKLFQTILDELQDEKT
uniref:Kinase n=2 Tax=Cacopsylla melanoneura TaxID=428564 RepID=A0A8D8RDX2_9HEMI